MNKFIFTAALLAALCIAGSALAQENWEALHKKSMDAYTAKDYEGAFTYTQQALAQAEKEYGIESQRYAVSAHNLAYMYSLRKNYPEASKYYQKAIAIREKMNLQADLALSAGLYGAMLHKELKDFANAEKYLLLALDANRKLYTEKSAQYYGAASELAVMYVAAGKYHQAEPYYLYMKQAMKEQKGATHEDYAEVLKDLMLLYDKLPDKDKYVTVYEEMLDIMAFHGMDNTMDYFERLFSLADYHEKQKNDRRAIALYHKMLPSLKKAYTDTSKFYIVILVKLVSSYNKLDDYKNVGAVSAELVSSLKRRPEDRDLYLDGLLVTATVFTRTADYQKAEESLLLFTDAVKRERGVKDTSYLRGMSNLGKVRQELGRHREAEEIFRANLQNRSLKDIAYVSDMISLGYILQLSGRIGEAEQLFSEAMKLLQSLGMERSNEYAVLLNYMGELMLGRNAGQGKSYLNQALSVYTATVGKEHPNYAVALAGLAAQYRYEGNYNEAEQLYLDYINNYKKYYGEDHPEYANSLIRLSSFYQTLGNKARSEDYLFRALDIQQKRLPEGHPVFLATYNHLGIFYNNTWQYDKAEKYYRLSLDIAKQNFGEKTDYLNTLVNLAGLYINTDNYTKSEETYREALALAKKLRGAESAHVGDILEGLGILYDDQADYAKAEQHFLQALAVFEKSLPPSNRKLADLNMRIAATYQAMRQPAKAEPYYEKVRTGFFSSIDQTFAFLSEAEKQNFLSSIEVKFASLQNFYLDYHLQKPAVAAYAFINELTTKGLTLNSSVEMRKAIEQSNNAQALKLYDDWMALRAEIAKRNTAGGESAENEKLETQAVDLEKQLTRLSAQFNQGRAVSKAGLEDIRGKLGENEVAIEFASFLRNDGEKWQDSVIYVAMVLRKNDASPRMIRLCHDRQLSELINKKGMDDDGFVSSLYRGTAGTSTQSNQSLSNGKKLYELVWQPIDHLLKEGDKVYFAPSGVLHQIAFAAIPYGDGKLLSDRYRLSQLSSTAMILNREAGAETPKSIALFGGIKYDLSPAEKTEAARRAGTAGRAVPAGAESKGNAWSYLPGTLAEAGAIAKQAEAAGYAAQTYFGTNGMEENMKKLAGKNTPGIIHIASHGFFFPDPQLNYQEQEKAEENAFSSSANAMNRSGMLFAGANDAWTGKTSATAEDGILTAYEASNLSLGNTGLVVLSACETGLGDIKGNEGVFGLQRAFKMAGVPYLMMSLWKVPDAETAEFMQAFYSGLFGGKGIESSFTGAQDTMKAKYPKEPYKWAAFVLVK